MRGQRRCQLPARAEYDAIVIGAGHNGLTAAVLLQRAGLRTVCLEAKRYAGGMASTVELFDGYQFEIAGSVQFPTSAVVSRELGLDTLPTVDLDVMSVSLRGIGDEPLIYYTDPMQLLTHLSEVHGVEAVNGMAGLMAWSQAPTRALGRFDAGTPPKTLDEMYACATNEFERSTHHRPALRIGHRRARPVPAGQGEARRAARDARLPGGQHHLSRAATPGSAAALAFGLAVPDENTMLMKKLQGGIGALTTHLREAVGVAAGGEVRLRTKVDEIPSTDGRVTGVRLEDGIDAHAPVVVSSLAPDLTLNGLLDRAALPAEVRERFAGIDHRGSYVQMHFALDGVPEFAAPYEVLNDPTMQAAIGLFTTPEELQQQWEDCRRGDRARRPGHRVPDPVGARPRPGAAGQARGVGVLAVVPRRRPTRPTTAGLKAEMGQRVIDKITRIAPNFESLITRHTTFTPRHMGTMFGAPGGDYCHGLIHPEQIGPNRPGPNGYVDQPHPVDGLYLGSAGCHGGPGITFIPGYNAAHQALADHS